MDTPASLLERLRLPSEQSAWDRFVRLYTPLIYSWARRVGLQSADAADLVQEVLTTLLQKLPTFTYDRQGSFRAWLRTITLNKWRDRCRRLAVRPHEVTGNPQLDVAEPDGDDSFAEPEYRQQLVARALELMQTEFQSTTWKACWEFAVVGRPVGEIARHLRISENAVYLAKARVLLRLREELAYLLD
jgi:RNA polymerase sigma-70 factor (ECF subfamily)